MAEFFSQASPFNKASPLLGSAITFSENGRFLFEEKLTAVFYFGIRQLMTCGAETE
jgi:hypothetical protein